MDETTNSNEERAAADDGRTLTFRCGLARSPGAAWAVLALAVALWELTGEALAGVLTVLLALGVAALGLLSPWSVEVATTGLWLGWPWARRQVSWSEIQDAALHDGQLHIWGARGFKLALSGDEADLAAALAAVEQHHAARQVGAPVDPVTEPMIAGWIAQVAGTPVVVSETGVGLGRRLGIGLAVLGVLTLGGHAWLLAPVFFGVAALVHQRGPDCLLRERVDSDGLTWTAGSRRRTFRWRDLRALAPGTGDDPHRLIFRTEAWPVTGRIRDVAWPVAEAILAARAEGHDVEAVDGPDAAALSRALPPAEEAARGVSLVRD